MPVLRMTAPLGSSYCRQSLQNSANYPKELFGAAGFRVDTRFQLLPIQAIDTMNRVATTAAAVEQAVCEIGLSGA
jgi:hypothetical protein